MSMYVFGSVSLCQDPGKAAEKKAVKENAVVYSGDCLSRLERMDRLFSLGFQRYEPHQAN